jgi:hypothetical protein
MLQVRCERRERSDREEKRSQTLKNNTPFPPAVTLKLCTSEIDSTVHNDYNNKCQM